jgi:hypothetical protein
MKTVGYVRFTESGFIWRIETPIAVLSGGPFPRLSECVDDMSEKLKAYEKEVSHENSNYPSILPGILG